MAGCEKCWRDAGYRAMSRMSDKVDEYRALLKEREGNPCSPEEQCDRPSQARGLCRKHYYRLRAKEQGHWPRKR